MFQKPWNSADSECEQRSTATQCKRIFVPTMYKKERLLKWLVEADPLSTSTTRRVCYCIKSKPLYLANVILHVGKTTHMHEGGTRITQEVPERINLPTFLSLFKNGICIKTSVCPNITLVGNSVPILKHSHIQNNISNKRIVGSSWSFTISIA
jgi:hypothetical protein